MKLLRKRIVKVPLTKVYDLETESESHNFCLSNGIVVHNSKDIADAVSGAVLSCYQDLDNASKLSNKYKSQYFGDSMKNRIVTNQLGGNTQQPQVKSLFG